jgi:hypothetical protein
MDISGQTSLKGLFQGMMPDSMGVVQGKVVSASPLKIQVVNDGKLVLAENLVCLPRHLSDYTAACDIRLGEGTIDGQTRNDGFHPHGPSGAHGGHAGGDGSHAHPDSEGAHVHSQATFDIYGATIKVYNALTPGETVYLLSFNEGKKYYVLDREVQR